LAAFWKILRRTTVTDPLVSDIPTTIDGPIPAEPLPAPTVNTIPLDLSIQEQSIPSFDRPLMVNVREATLLTRPPWTRSLGNLAMTVSTQGWRFPAPEIELPPPKPRVHRAEPGQANLQAAASKEQRTRLRPSSDMVLFKDRLLYMLQPPLEDIFAGKQIQLPFKPYPYQLNGIAFLIPRDAALIADEMGLGKTMQTILALRLLFHSSLIRRDFPLNPGTSPGSVLLWAATTFPTRPVNAVVAGVGRPSMTARATRWSAPRGVPAWNSVSTTAAG
jgi:hypothetical protein